MLKALTNSPKVVMFPISTTMKIGMVMVVTTTVKLTICLRLSLIMTLLSTCVLLTRTVWYGFGNSLTVSANPLTKIEMGATPAVSLPYWLLKGFIKSMLTLIHAQFFLLIRLHWCVAASGRAMQCMTILVPTCLSDICLLPRLLWYRVTFSTFPLDNPYL